MSCRREEVISVRVRPNERAVLEMVAAAEGESLSAFVRGAVLDVARAIRKVAAEEGITEQRATPVEIDPRRHWRCPVCGVRTNGPARAWVHRDQGKHDVTLHNIYYRTFRRKR